MFRVFGDIENNTALFDTVMRNIALTPPNRRIIYLGDMYSPYDPNTTIDQVGQLLRAHRIPILNVFNQTNIHDIDYVQSQWRALYNQKHLDIYNKEYIQFMTRSPLGFPLDEDPKQTKQCIQFGIKRVQPPPKSIPPKPNGFKLGNNRFAILAESNESYTTPTPPVKPVQPLMYQNKPNWNQSLGSSNDPSVPIIILGNKDLGFVRQMLDPIRMSTNHKHKLRVVYHSFRKYDNGKIHAHKYTCNELNIMYTFIMQTRHYFIYNGILYIHCYGNAIRFNHVPFNKIVCGHNKGFGMFKDDKHKGKSIFMIDYTGATDETLIPPNVYFDINGSHVAMQDDRFIPTDYKPCKMVSVSENMLLSPLTGHYEDSSEDVEVTRHTEMIKQAFLTVRRTNKVYHQNKYTKYHDCYSDTELLDNEHFFDDIDFKSMYAKDT